MAALAGFVGPVALAAVPAHADADTDTAQSGYAQCHPFVSCSTPRVGAMSTLSNTDFAGACLEAQWWACLPEGDNQ